MLRVLSVSLIGVGVVVLGCSAGGTSDLESGGMGNASPANAGGGPLAGNAGSAGSAGNASLGGALGASGSGPGGSSGSGAGVSGAGASGAGGVNGSSGSSGASSGGSAGLNGSAGQATGGNGGGGGSTAAVGCLPDGSGSITMTFAGSKSFNQTRKNDYACVGNFSSNTSAAGLILRVDGATPEEPYGVVIANFSKFDPGQVGSIAFDQLNFFVTPGGVWSDPNVGTPNMKRCTFNVTANQALPGAASDYRVSGSISCSSALAGVPGAMTVQKVQFVTMLTTAP